MGLKRVTKWRPYRFKHLKEMEIGYFRHLGRAWLFSFYCLECFLGTFLHGLWPDVFTNTSEELESHIESFVFDDEE